MVETNTALNTVTDRARKSATLDDVAALVGVSRMAVSVVLNGSKSGTRVSQAKRDQILAAAKELNYRPNVVARSLARKATHIFGFYSGFDYLDVRNPFIAEITAGLLEECNRCGRDLLLHTIFRGHDINHLHDELVGGKIDGLVIWAPEDDPLAALLAGSHLPVVSIVEPILSFPTVIIDDYAGGFEMGRYLHRQGHQSILYQTLERPSISRRRRLKGMQDYCNEVGVNLSTIVDPTPEELLSAIQRLETTDSRPTALACWNDTSANQAISIFKRAAITVPAEISVTGFDGIQPAMEPELRLTTVYAPWAEVASIAIRNLIALVQTAEVARETMLPVLVMPGETA